MNDSEMESGYDSDQYDYAVLQDIPLDPDQGSPPGQYDQGSPPGQFDLGPPRQRQGSPDRVHNLRGQGRRFFPSIDSPEYGANNPAEQRFLPDFVRRGANRGNLPGDGVVRRRLFDDDPGSPDLIDESFDDDVFNNTLESGYASQHHSNLFNHSDDEADMDQGGMPIGAPVSPEHMNASGRSPRMSLGFESSAEEGGVVGGLVTPQVMNTPPRGSPHQPSTPRHRRPGRRLDDLDGSYNAPGPSRRRPPLFQPHGEGLQSPHQPLRSMQFLNSPRRPAPPRRMSFSTFDPPDDPPGRQPRMSYPMRAGDDQLITSSALTLPGNQGRRSPGSLLTPPKMSSVLSSTPLGNRQIPQITFTPSPGELIPRGKPAKQDPTHLSPIRKLEYVPFSGGGGNRRSYSDWLDDTMSLDETIPLESALQGMSYDMSPVVVQGVAGGSQQSSGQSYASGGSDHSHGQDGAVFGLAAGGAGGSPGGGSDPSSSFSTDRSYGSHSSSGSKSSGSSRSSSNRSNRSSSAGRSRRSSDRSSSLNRAPIPSGSPVAGPSGQQRTFGVPANATRPIVKVGRNAAMYQNNASSEIGESTDELPGYSVTPDLEGTYVTGGLEPVQCFSPPASPVQRMQEVLQLMRDNSDFANNWTLENYEKLQAYKNMKMRLVNLVAEFIGPCEGILPSTTSSDGYILTMFETVLDDLVMKYSKFNLEIREVIPDQVDARIEDHKKKILEVVDDYESRLNEVREENLQLKEHDNHLDTQLTAALLRIQHLDTVNRQLSGEGQSGTAQGGDGDPTFVECVDRVIQSVETVKGMLAQINQSATGGAGGLSIADASRLGAFDTNNMNQLGRDMGNLLECSSRMTTPDYGPEMSRLTFPSGLSFLDSCGGSFEEGLNVLEEQLDNVKKSWEQSVAESRGSDTSRSSSHGAQQDEGAALSTAMALIRNMQNRVVELMNEVNTLGGDSSGATSWLPPAVILENNAGSFLECVDRVAETVDVLQNTVAQHPEIRQDNASMSSLGILDSADMERLGRDICHLDSTSGSSRANASLSSSLGIFNSADIERLAQDLGSLLECTRLMIPASDLPRLNVSSSVNNDGSFLAGLDGLQVRLDNVRTLWEEGLAEASGIDTSRSDGAELEESADTSLSRMLRQMRHFHQNAQDLRDIVNIAFFDGSLSETKESSNLSTKEENFLSRLERVTQHRNDSVLREELEHARVRNVMLEQRLNEMEVANIQAQQECIRDLMEMERQTHVNQVLTEAIENVINPQNEPNMDDCRDAVDQWAEMMRDAIEERWEEIEQIQPALIDYEERMAECRRRERYFRTELASYIELTEFQKEEIEQYKAYKIELDEELKATKKQIGSKRRDHGQAGPSRRITGSSQTKKTPVSQRKPSPSNTQSLRRNMTPTIRQERRRNITPNIRQGQNRNTLPPFRTGKYKAPPITSSLNTSQNLELRRSQATSRKPRPPKFRSSIGKPTPTSGHGASRKSLIPRRIPGGHGASRKPSPPSSQGTSRKSLIPRRINLNGTLERSVRLSSPGTSEPVVFKSATCTSPIVEDENGESFTSHVAVRLGKEWSNELVPTRGAVFNEGPRFDVSTLPVRTVPFRPGNVYSNELVPSRGVVFDPGPRFDLSTLPERRVPFRPRRTFPFRPGNEYSDELVPTRGAVFNEGPMFDVSTLPVRTVPFRQGNVYSNELVPSRGVVFDPGPRFDVSTLPERTVPLRPRRTFSFRPGNEYSNALVPTRGVVFDPGPRLEVPPLPDGSMRGQYIVNQGQPNDSFDSTTSEERAILREIRQVTPEQDYRSSEDSIDSTTSEDRAILREIRQVTPDPDYGISEDSIDSTTSEDRAILREIRQVTPEPDYGMSEDSIDSTTSEDRAILREIRQVTPEPW